MTSPQQQQEPSHPVEDAVIAALVAYFLTSAAVKAVFLPVKLAARLEGLGLAGKAVREAGRLALEPPLTGRGAHGLLVPTTTARRVKNEEPLMRARYVLNAAKRLTRAITLGVYPQALRVEATYLKQHRQAGQNRLQAAKALDEVAAQFGLWLVWRTKRDNRVGPECAALEGRVFTLDNLPNGQIPGAVHPTCRCTATPLF